ncbi:hypothetical protein Tco_1169965, partial [Tanacetum coccineum]
EDHSSYIKVSESAQDTDGKLIQLMHTTMVPEQVKTKKIQAGVQVSRLEDKDVIFSFESALIAGNCVLADKMADENVPSPAPTRSNDQILPFAAWVPNGKSNYVLDLQKK